MDDTKKEDSDQLDSTLANFDKELADSYLEGVVSYLKWTSTITLAAIFWIGSNFLRLEKDVAVLVSIVSIVLLFVALFKAMELMIRVVGLRGIEWHPYYRARILAELFPGDPEYVKSVAHRWKKELDTHMSGIRNPSTFARELNRHFDYLSMGLFLYIFTFVIENMGSITSVITTIRSKIPF